MSSKGESSVREGSGAALAPNLRFPEFRESGAWETAPGDKLFRQVNNRDAPSGLPILAITQEHGAIPRHMIDYNVSVTDKSLKTYKEVRAGDFIISLRSFQGGIEYSDYHGICSPAYVILRKRGRLSDGFFRQHFKSHNFIQQLTRNLEGLRDGKMISYKQFSELQILNPTPSEQQKIADCLDSVDALIAAQGRKVEALRAHKKGLMQQLFPQEGETQPRLRFPEFAGEGDWVEEPLNSCLSRVIDYRGKAPPKSESGVPLITAKNVRLGWLDMSNDEYIDEDQYETWMSRGLPRAGDVLFTTEAPLGNVALFPRGGKFAVGQRLLTLRSNPKKCLSEFLFQSLLGPGMQGKIEYYSTGSTAKGIKSSVFVNIPFIRPKGVGEQQRIADILTSLDDLIAAEIRKLDSLATHKKGLMQQLFPRVGERDA